MWGWWQRTHVFTHPSGFVRDAPSGSLTRRRHYRPRWPPPLPPPPAAPCAVPPSTSAMMAPMSPLLLCAAILAVLTLPPLCAGQGLFPDAASNIALRRSCPPPLHRFASVPAVSFPPWPGPSPGFKRADLHGPHPTCSLPGHRDDGRQALAH